jgi:hypothetical protein
MSSTRGNSYDSGVDPRNSFTSDLIDERVSFNSTYEPDTQAEKVASFISYGSAKKNDEDADYSFRIGDENSWGLGDEASTHVYRLSEEGTI